MRINDENILKEMRKNTDKSKRVNSYKVKYMKFNGQYEELTFNQGYDASTDCYNPFFICVYNSNNSSIISSSGSTIENAYNSLITSLIQYEGEAIRQREKYNAKLAKINGILNPDSDDDDFDNRF